MWRPSAIARHGSQTPHGSIVGPPCPSGPMQLSALATSRAVEVLPTPRTPVSRKAWAMRPRSIALAERLHHRVLADQLGEGLRPVFAGEHAIGRRRRPASAAASGRSRPRPGDSSSMHRAVGLGGGCTCVARCTSWRWKPNDPGRNRCGCFLPDLTRLATAPSADFRARIWVKMLCRASSPSAFIDRSRGRDDCDADPEVASCPFSP